MKEKIKALRLEGNSYKAIAGELGITYNVVKYQCNKMGLAGLNGGQKGNQYGSVEKRERVFKEKFEKKFPKFNYHSGFTSVDESFYMQCKTCGGIQERNAQLVRPSRDKYLTCDHCMLIAKGRLKKRRLSNTIAREIRQTIQVEVNILNKIRDNHRHCITCDVCGKQFFSSTERVTCSPECGKKRNNRIKSIRRDKRIAENGDIDWDITLDKLIKINNNTCYICGKECDSEDYILREDGVHIAGDNYPSIEHLNPISKGGTHTWDNIRLAHRGCNSRKSSKRIYVSETGQVMLALWGEQSHKTV